MDNTNFRQPLVSIIIPTYKRSNTILSTIQSVLSQTYQNIEIIVVDDNGKGTMFQCETQKLLAKLIEDKKITYVLHETNKNGSAARNTGLKISKGEYINFLDDDDILMPTKIEEQVRCLQNTDSKVGATYCNSRIIHYQSLTHKLIEKLSDVSDEGNLCKEYILGLCKFNTSMIMFKRTAIEQINGFDESFIRHQDYELMIRFFRHYNIVCTSLQPLAIYDQTSERVNAPDCEKDFIMKEKLMSLFSDDFEKIKAKNEIGHYLWLRCAYNSSLKRNYKYVRLSLIKSRAYGCITYKEYMKLFKSIIIGLLKK